MKMLHALLVNCYRHYVMLLLAIGLSCVIVYAQSSRLFSTADALPNTLINDVIEDANSMIWVATEYGLCKYDGSKFTTYQYEVGNPNSLQNNYVRTLFVDVKGHLLIGSRCGLQVYRPETDDFSEVARFVDCQLESGDVTHIIERKNGEIWACGNTACCIRIRQDGTPELYSNPFTDKVRFTESIAEDATGRLWISRRLHEVWYMESDGQVMKFEQEGTDLAFNTMYVARDGGLYTGGLKPGLFRYNAATNRFDKQDIGGGNYLIRALTNLDNENLLVATDNAGLKVFNCRTCQMSDYPFEDDILDFSTQKVHGICIDHNQVMWLCLYQKGLMMVPQNSQPFHNLGGKSLYGNVLSDKCITSIMQTSQNEIWMASDNGGVFVVDGLGRQKKHFPYTGLPNSLPSALVKIFKDSRQRCWYGSYGAGYGWIDPETGRCTGLAIKGQEDATFSVYDFAEDKSGRIWAISIDAGVFVFDEPSRTLIPLPNNDSCRWACCSYFDDSRNKLYVGSYNGLTEIDLDKEDTPMRQYLGQYIVFAACQYTSGRLALCTTEGLLLFDQNTGEYVKYGLVDGLPSELVLAAECDASGLLWVVTNVGLSCFNEKRRAFINYTVHDGLRSNEFYKNASMKDLSGRLWFGGTDGVTYFNPQEVNLEGEKCQVRIVDITSGGRKLQGRSHYFEDSSFSFEMATLPLYRTLHAVYSYSLDGDPWTELRQGQNQVSFSHVSPGNHEFRYRAQVSGIESEVMSYTFYIVYPWYRQWWMNLIVVVLVAVIVYLGFLQWRHRHFVKTRLAQHVQTQAINEAKLQFFMNIAHEIRTPMTMIVSPLHKLISSDDNPDHQHVYRMMQRNANRIVGTINQLMDLRKIDQKQMKLYCSEVDIAAMIRDLCESMQDVADVRQIQLSLVDNTPQGLKLWVDTSNFDKILINLLSNAMKFTPLGGKVEVSIATQGATEQFPKGRFVMKVTDTGEGVPNHEKRRIFERFYQVRSTAAGKTGTGIGLHLTASLVKLHHGTIDVSDNPEGRGTCFTVVLPLDNAHLKGSEISTDPVETANVVRVSTEEISPDAYADETEQITSVSQSHHLVVVAEDDAEIRRYIVQEISSFCRVIECSNGKEALDYIMHQVPDLLLSDVMMPEMDGFELCRKIRSNVRLNHIPIVLLTAKSDEESRIESLDLGADAFLTKPFSMEVLRRTIRNLLRSRANLRNTYSGQQMPVDQVEVANTKSPDERLMERILKVVNQNINNPNLTTEMIASDVGMSRVHLYRKLKELTNQSARNFIRNIRLAKAAELLAQKKCSVAEVADRVGFPNPSNFATSFKEMYGVTPTAYMEEHIKKNESETSEA